MGPPGVVVAGAGPLPLPAGLPLRGWLMPVHVGEVTTEVTVDGAGNRPGGAPAPCRSPWREAEDQCRLLERRAAIRARTAAEGFDD